MEVNREKTMFFSFRDTDFNPSELEIHRWLRKLNINDGELVVIDYHFHTKHVVIKFKEQNILDKFIEDFGNSVIFEKDNTNFEIPISVAGSKRKIVRMKFIPDEMDIDEIKLALNKFGKVNNIKWEMPNTVAREFFKVKRERLIIEMIVVKNIPSFLTIKGIKIAVSYPGQLKTCSRCNDTSHEVKECPNNDMNYVSALKRSLPSNYNQQEVTSLAQAITELENIVMEAENETTLGRQNEGNKDEKSKKNRTSKWNLVTKKKTVNTSKFRKTTPKKSKKASNETSDDETCTSEEEEEEVELTNTDTEQRSPEKKKTKKVQISKELNDKSKKIIKTKQNDDSKEVRFREYNQDNMLLNKTKAIIKNKKKFKPIVDHTRPSTKTNGTSGYPWDDLDSQISVRSQQGQNEQSETIPVKENTQTLSKDPNQNVNTNFYDNIPSPLLNT